MNWCKKVTLKVKEGEIKGEVNENKVTDNSIGCIPTLVMLFQLVQGKQLKQLLGAHMQLSVPLVEPHSRGKLGTMVQ